MTTGNKFYFQFSSELDGQLSTVCIVAKHMVRSHELPLVWWFHHIPAVLTLDTLHNLSPHM